jgi:hypothetical protein
MTGCAGPCGGHGSCSYDAVLDDLTCTCFSDGGHYNASTDCVECMEGWSSSASCKDCTVNYYGAECQPCPAINGLTCNGHGECHSGINGDGGCTCSPSFTGAQCTECSPGYFGPNCEPCPSAYGLVCSGHGVCTSDGTCQCVPPYFGSVCQVAMSATTCCLCVAAPLGCTIITTTAD